MFEGPGKNGEKMAKEKPKILVIDDGVEYARVVGQQLQEFELVLPHGADGPWSLTDGPSALAYLDKQARQIDVVLLDMNFDIEPELLLPLGKNISPRRTRRFQGVAILREIRRRFPDLPVVLLTAIEDLSLVDVDGELAGQSMTYVLDGEDLDTLRIRIHAALVERQQGLEDGGVLWGSDRSMHAIRRRLQVLARGSMPVILEGETGTGKSFIAEKFVHKQSGRRGPFVTLDLSAIPRDLVPAHLFGALKGSYTGALVDRKGAFELAHRGTLFIDELQNIPLEVQKQLLVVLQDRRVRPLGAAREVEIDVKVVAATNESLAEAVTQGRFRQDLYMRLGPASRVVLPPLRQRPEDLPILARRLAKRAAQDPDIKTLRSEVTEEVGLVSVAPLEVVLGRGSATPEDTLQLMLPQAAWKRLRQHPWPGNMRELSMVMHNLVSFTLLAAVDAIHSGMPVHAPRLQIDAGLVGELLAGSERLTAVSSQAGILRDDEVTVQLRPAKALNGVAIDVERQYLRSLFEKTRGDFAKMAELLLGDASRARAVQLRFNQVGLKVRELRKG